MRTRCPCCGTTASLDVLVAHEDARAALSAVFQIDKPLGTALVRYLSLHRPATRELTMARVATLLGELLPYLHRGAVPRKGRDWPVTPAQWAQAVEQMCQARDAGKLQTPLNGHGYLFEVLAGLVDKTESMQEQAQEVALRQARVPTEHTVTVRGQAMSIGQGLAQVFGGRDPALAKLDADAKHTTGPSPAMRQKLAELRASYLSKPLVPVVPVSPDLKD